MQLQHDFTVPVPPDQAWDVLLDLERVAPCMPGATLESVDGDEFTGKVKVKVGPIQVTYQGSGRFVAKDEAGRRAVIEAAAREARGSGTAKATVTALLHDAGGETRVEVTTDLAITGRPAQFGRSVMSEVGAKLIGKFADCLAEEILAGSSAPAEDATEAVDAPGLAPAAHGAAEAEEPPAPAAPALEPARATPAGAAQPGGSDAATAGSSVAGTAAAGPATPPDARTGVGAGSTGASAQRRGPEDAAPAAAARPRPQPEAIDLLDVAGASVAKRVIPVAAVLAALVALLVWRRRRSR